MNLNDFIINIQDQIRNYHRFLSKTNVDILIDDKVVRLKKGTMTKPTKKKI